MAPTAIRYYTLINNGVGIIIWPQLRSASNPVSDIPWNGRDSSGYDLAVGQQVTVDLANTGLKPGTQFYLSCDVLFGKDMWDEHDTFVFDPSSEWEATAQKYGPVRGGGLQFLGLRKRNKAREALRAAYDAENPVTAVTVYMPPKQSQLVAATEY